MQKTQLGLIGAAPVVVMGGLSASPPTAAAQPATAAQQPCIPTVSGPTLGGPRWRPPQSVAPRAGVRPLIRATSLSGRQSVDLYHRDLGGADGYACIERRE